MTRILLVEDNEMNRDVITRRLEMRGFEVTSAEDGERALERAEADAPDLILLDMGLPGIDGWEVARRLKAGERTGAVPIIALTAHVLSEDRARALAAGCDDFDSKPIELDRLLGKIAALTGGRDPEDRKTAP
jgi:CheY-like chemotaxis protein